MNKIAILFIASCYSMQATWHVAQIVNQSDLRLSQAARVTRQSDLVEIQSLSQKIKDQYQQSVINLGRDNGFGPVGRCQIVAYNAKNEPVKIIFLADPMHKVATGRIKAVNSQFRMNAGLDHTGMMARVALEHHGKKEIIGSYCCYKKDNQPFKLILQGADGRYHVDLVPIT